MLNFSRIALPAALVISSIGAFADLSAQTPVDPSTPPPANPAPAAVTRPSGGIDVAVTYIALRSLKANTNQNFWQQGGSIQIGTNVFHGFGIAADVTGSHASSIGSSGVPLSLLTVTLGPRYRWHADHKFSIYGEGLVGEANGFSSLFPAPGGAISGSNSLAVQAGIGIDYRLSQRFAFRVLDAGYLYTQLPNSTDNVQHNLRLGAGIVVRFGH